MAWVLWLGLALVPFWLGKGFLAFLNGKKKKINIAGSEAYLTGLIVCIGLTEAAHLSAVFLGLSFTGCVKVWSVLMTGCLVLILLSWTIAYLKKHRKPTYARELEREKLKKKMNKASYTTAQQLLYLGFGLSVLIQAVLLVTGQNQYRTGDMTVETVNTFLSTDALWQVNPMTGQAYGAGIPLRLKILSLPTLYAALCRLFDLTAVELVTRFVPVVVLAATYLVYICLADFLFHGKRTGRGIFLLLVSVIFWLGDYAVVMDGFGLLHCGYRGTVIRSTVLVPYTVYLCLKDKWWAAALCVLAEACIVWTLYGMGACLLVMGIMAAVKLLMKRLGGKWGGIQWNS